MSAQEFDFDRLFAVDLGQGAPPRAAEATSMRSVLPLRFVHGEAGSCEESFECFGASMFGDGVEPAIKYAVAGFERFQHPAKRFRGVASLVGQCRRVGPVRVRGADPRGEGGCWRTRNWTGKSQALSAPANAPMPGSSISRPRTSSTASLTPSARTGPSSSTWEIMNDCGSAGGTRSSGRFFRSRSETRRIRISSDSPQEFQWGGTGTTPLRMSAAMPRAASTTASPTTARATAARALPGRSSAPSAISRKPAQTMAKTDTDAAT